ncbi:GOLPH3/VPS74 family protein [Actinoplanes sp. URMC 104]|uniref:GOLPH3/VPS74 family protein n=1 Tax=Actinoplanes sp. URMC 104 TaxID=3423409 RepID=UPI003F1991C6
MPREPHREQTVRWSMLANELFLTVHEDNGRLRLHRDVARAGLAAATIAELMLMGHAGIEHGNLIAATGAQPIDPLAAILKQRIRAERAYAPVRVWLQLLATETPADGDVYDRVAARMERAGVVRRRETGLIRRTTRWMPCSMNDAAWPAARLSTALYQGKRLDVFDKVLGGLLLALELHSTVLTGDSDVLEALLRAHLEVIDDSYGELFYQTETLIAASAITG